ncbi:MAG: hypothetical protein II575_14370 [Bacteroidales bacterium]|nr:hypothetical protein [Bacteroidales bacterium]
MKRLVLLFTILVLVFVGISCNKYENRRCQLAAVSLRYPEIKEADTLKVCIIKTEQNDLSSVVGVSKYEIVNCNHFPLELNDIDHERYGYGEYFNDYIVYIENTEYRDTVTDIKIEWEEPCKVASCQYRFNGELHNGNGGFIDIYPRENN